MGRRVLLVEDETATRVMLRQLLLDRGLEVAIAEGGMAALRVAASFEPQIVVLDIGLPDLDGPAFAALWRARQPSPQKARFVVVSGHPNGARLAREMGATAFFAKPFDFRAVADAVAALPVDETA